MKVTKKHKHILVCVAFICHNTYFYQKCFVKNLASVIYPSQCECSETIKFHTGHVRPLIIQCDISKNQSFSESRTQFPILWLHCSCCLMSAALCSLYGQNPLAVVNCSFWEEALTFIQKHQRAVRLSINWILPQIFLQEQWGTEVCTTQSTGTQ